MIQLYNAFLQDLRRIDIGEMKIQPLRDISHSLYPVYT